MPTKLTALLATTLALLSLASCATSTSSSAASPANIERGCRIVLDQSLWGTPLPWRQFKQADVAMSEIAIAVATIQGMPGKAANWIGRPNCDLGQGTLGALQAKHGKAERVTTEDGYNVHHYGWFGFGTKDGNSLRYFSTTPAIYDQGIEAAARQHLGR